MTVSTIQPDAPTTLEGLKAAYLVEIEELIQRYPAQEANRASYMKCLEGAKLGTMLRRFASNGEYTVLPVGAKMLVLTTEVMYPDEDPVTVFAPSIRGPLHLSGMPATWVSVSP